MNVPTIAGDILSTTILSVRGVLGKGFEVYLRASVSLCEIAVSAGVRL